jgi:hypothetical protein
MPVMLIQAANDYYSIAEQRAGARAVAFVETSTSRAKDLSSVRGHTDGHNFLYFDIARWEQECLRFLRRTSHAV